MCTKKTMDNTMVSNDKKCILFLLPSLGRGGAEMQVVNLVNGLDSEKFEKHLVCFDKDVSLLENLDRKLVVFHHIQRASFFDIKVSRKIASLIDELQVDLVHCSLQIALFFGWVAVRQSETKPPITVALHTTVNRNLKAELFDWAVYQWLMRSCKIVICVCEAQEKHWQKKFPFLKKLTQVVYNGVDIDYFSSLTDQEQVCLLRGELNISENTPIICHIAGFRPEKGHFILLDAFEQTLKHRQNIILIFVGDGALRSHVEDVVRAKGISANIRFLGAVQDVRPVLAISDLSVIASTAETFSIAMLESMAMGVPLLATDAGGTGEAVIDGKTGYLVSVADKKELELGLLNALNDLHKLKKMGREARKLVIEFYAREGMIRKTEKLLSDIVEENNA